MCCFVSVEQIKLIKTPTEWHVLLDGFPYIVSIDSRHLQEFDAWLQDTLATGEHSPEERKALFANWADAPSGRYSHPREEHLRPAHVALGCGGDRAAVVMFSGSLFGAAVSSLRWD